MPLEIWIMRIAVSNVVSEYSLGGVNFTRRRSLSSFVIPKKSSQLFTLLLARGRARQISSGGFVISISGTTNRSEIMDSCNLNVLHNRLSGYLHQ